MKGRLSPLDKVGFVLVALGIVFGPIPGIAGSLVRINARHEHISRVEHDLPETKEATLREYKSYAYAEVLWFVGGVAQGCLMWGIALLLVSAQLQKRAVSATLLTRSQHHAALLWLIRAGRRLRLSLLGLALPAA